MTLDRDKLLAMPPVITRHAFARKDTILYALGVGADDLDFVYEERLRALPTMAVVLGYPGFRFWQTPEFGVDAGKILHGEQSITLEGPLPVEGAFRGETVFESIFDKGPGKGAIALLTRRIYDDRTNRLLATTRQTSFLRGDGGCGGPSDGAPVPHPVPEDRAPDQDVALPTSPHQALIYRLSGDLNALHIDPDAAKAGGFDKPILHGLCTYGVIGRALIRTLMDNQPERLKRMDVRFSSPVFPGETIRTEIWKEGDGEAAFRAFVHKRQAKVVNNGYVEFA